MPTKPMCCKALTASCEACKAGTSVGEFCKKKPGFAGCPAKPTTPTNPITPTNPTTPTKPTTTPTTGKCVDVAGWHDAHGSKYTCDWYAKGSRCVRYGNKVRYGNMGHTG